MMRTILVAALSLTACTANPAAHAFLRDQAARSVDNDDRREPTPAIAFSTPADRSVMRIVDEPEEPMPVAAREPDPEPATVEDEPPVAITEDVPPPAPDEPETPEEIEPEPQDDPVVEAPVNPHPACRRATPAAFC